MLDFYADWCVSCKEMERYTFTDDARQAAARRHGRCCRRMSRRTRPSTQALLKRFRLFGPPGHRLLRCQGREIEGLRVIGFQPADKFAAVLDQALRSPANRIAMQPRGIFSVAAHGDSWLRPRRATLAVMVGVRRLAAPPATGSTCGWRTPATRRTRPLVRPCWQRHYGSRRRPQGHRQLARQGPRGQFLGYLVRAMPGGNPRVRQTAGAPRPAGCSSWASRSTSRSRSGRFARELRINYPLLIGGLDTMELDAPIRQQGGVLPFTLILDRQGKVARSGHLEELEARDRPENAVP